MLRRLGVSADCLEMGQRRHAADHAAGAALGGLDVVFVGLPSVARLAADAGEVAMADGLAGGGAVHAGVRLRGLVDSLHPRLAPHRLPLHRAHFRCHRAAFPFRS